jgi:Sulfotransferase family
MRHPNLFILGAQRAGTTWLSDQLMRHPDIFFSTPKEPLLMGRKVAVTLDDYKQYLASAFKPPLSRMDLFSKLQERKYMAEGSANYFQSPFALDRIRVFVPGRPKFIICLRHPVAKGISFFIHNWRRGRYKPGTGFSETLTPLGQFSPLFSSLYGEPIRRWLAAYPREDFLFLKYDDFSRDPVRYLSQVSDFLQIAPFPTPSQKVINRGLSLVWKDDFLSPLDPGPADHPAIGFDELKDMHATVLPDIKLTQDLTGLDLSDWLTLRREDMVDGASRLAMEKMIGVKE